MSNHWNQKCGECSHPKSSHRVRLKARRGYKVEVRGCKVIADQKTGKYQPCVCTGYRKAE